MARRRSRKSRRLHGFGWTDDVHLEQVGVAERIAKRAFENAALYAAEGKCKTAMTALLNGSSVHGEAVAHGLSASGDTGTSAALTKKRKQAIELFRGACLDASKLSGLGRTRKSRRRARR